MKRTLVLVSAALLLLALFACSENALMKSMSVNEKMDRGNALYEQGKWRKAAPYFQEVVFERRTAFTNEAQFKLAECYFNQEKWSDARYEYEELIRLFPDYSDIAIAYYRLAQCWFEESLSFHYTQDETVSAIDAFRVFIERFPDNGHVAEAQDFIVKAQYKLLQKSYMNGYIYYRTYDYSAALLYFDEVRAAALNDPIDCKSLYYSAKIHLYRKDYEKAQPVIAELVARYPQSREARRLGKRLAEQP